MTHENVINNNRIMYVDPNYVRGDINNVPLTPDYTKFCIWCNLTVERTSRLKNQAGGESEDEVYSIAFDMTNADLKSNSVSFFSGKDAKNYNFLTTDYTNINFSEINKRNIIEGLLVESVNVAFINYQTPQVTIKFVDIRGGGFFGREEATHNEYGHLSNLETDENQNKFDNFFSCFVSFPYPRFRLQIKGFYGKPVTFQLTCTNFNGNFNSATGNFEITVQFIGYEYGILGDIPFDLLVAAPLTAVGSEYWNEHVADMANNGWALDKDATEAPCLLLHFYDYVSGALQNMSSEEMAEFMQDDANEAAMTGLTEQIKMLGEIQNYQNEIKDLCRSIFSPYYVSEYSDKEENTLLIYSVREIYETNSNINELLTKYETYINCVNEYKRKYENDNSQTENEIKFNNRFTDFLKHQIKSGSQKDRTNHSNMTSKGVVDAENPTSCSAIQVNQMFSPSPYTISDGMSKKIVEDLSIWNWAIYGGTFNDGIPFAKYVSAVCLGISPSDKISELQSNYNSYKADVNSFKKRKISDIVGFTPYIGRYFKIVMCHLETFVELFYKCADGIQEDINSDLRIPSKLGIYNLTTQTDVPGNIYKNVPPFPSVYKKYNPTGDEDNALMTGKDIVSDAWIGDFQGVTKWREEELIDELFKAAMKISDSRKFQAELGHVNNDCVNSVFPIDCIASAPKYAYTSLDGAMFYAALRAEVTLDFMQKGRPITNDLAYNLGMMDGYFYISRCCNTEFTKRLYNITNLSSELYNATVYCDSFVSYPDVRYYEFVKVYRERHPVFIENGNNVEYSYMTNQTTNNVYVPLESMSALGGLNGFAKFYNYDNGHDFTPKDPNSNNFLVGHSNSVTNYSETAHFEIITNQDRITSIIENYNKLINGEVSIGSKPFSDFTSIINTYTSIGNSSTPVDVIENPNPSIQQNFCSYGEMDFMEEEQKQYMVETKVKNVFDTSNGNRITTPEMVGAVNAFMKIKY